MTAEERFTRIYSAARDRAVRLASRRRQADAEDALQQAAIYAWQRWDEISAMTDAEIEGWLIYQAYLRASDINRGEQRAKRDERRRVPFLYVENMVGADDDGLGQIVVDDLLDAVQPVHARMARLRLAGYGWSEIAPELGLTPRQIRTQRQILQGALSI